MRRRAHAARPDRASCAHRGRLDALVEEEVRVGAQHFAHVHPGDLGVVALVPMTAGRLDEAVVVALSYRGPFVHDGRVQFIVRGATRVEVSLGAVGGELQALLEGDVRFQLCATARSGVEAEALQVEHEHLRRRVHPQPLACVRERPARFAAVLIFAVEVFGCSVVFQAV